MNVQAIHQIEMTSRCNLRCKYCAHPTMPRAKMDMDEKTFVRAVEVARELYMQHGHRELNLAGIGESTMHPQFLDFLTHARVTMPREVTLVLATNGLLVTPELARKMAAIRGAFDKPIAVWVSLHRPEKAGLAVKYLREAGMLTGVSADPSVYPTNWAGQVNWHVNNALEGTECSWLKEGKVIVASNGDLLQCSFDASGAGKVGTIWESPGSQGCGPYSLCASCHHKVPS